MVTSASMRPILSPAEISPGAVWLDARARGGRAAYEAGHLVGARFADLERDLSAPGDPAVGGRHPLPPIEAFARTLGRWGVTPASRVVVYDDAGGALAAARAWWMLRAVGHERVGVLDGGLAAALDHGLELTTDAAVVEEAAPYPVPRTWSRPTVERHEIPAAQRLGRVVVDVRAPARYRGEEEPIDPAAGHVPGAVNAPFEESLDARGRFLPAAELASRLDARLGDVEADRLILSCGSGVTACHTLLVLDALGRPGAALYVGSWSEWCRNPG